MIIFPSTALLCLILAYFVSSNLVDLHRQEVIDFATAFLEQFDNRVGSNLERGDLVPDLNERPEPEILKGMLHKEMTAVRDGKEMNKEDFLVEVSRGEWPENVDLSVRDFGFDEHTKSDFVDFEIKRHGQRRENGVRVMVAEVENYELKIQHMIMFWYSRVHD